MDIQQKIQLTKVWYKYVVIVLKNTEHDYQVQVIDWANAHHVKYPPLRWLYAIPNGAREERPCQ